MYWQERTSSPLDTGQGRVKAQGNSLIFIYRTIKRRRSRCSSHKGRQIKNTSKSIAQVNCCNTLQVWVNYASNISEFYFPLRNLTMTLFQLTNRINWSTNGTPISGFSISFDVDGWNIKVGGGRSEYHRHEPLRGSGSMPPPLPHPPKNFKL